MPRAERRLLTIMFCDVVGSTELATRLDPEDLREVIGAYHRCVAECLAQFGGFVAKYMGDGILAYFGYPQAHEEDAEQAVRAGLAIVEARVGKLDLVSAARGAARHRHRPRGGRRPPRRGRGAGAIGRRRDAQPRGAAAIARRCPTVSSSPTPTQRHIGGLFEVRDLGPQELKGFAGTTHAWQVIGESGVASRFEALRSRETPLVGRDEELDLLLAPLGSGARRAKGASCCSRPNRAIGKSRLTEALEERIAGEPHLRLRYFCSPHHQDSALYPIIGQLERAAGFARDDTPAGKAQKLAELLARRSDDLALFADLLSLAAARRPSRRCRRSKRRKKPSRRCCGSWRTSLTTSRC